MMKITKKTFLKIFNKLIEQQRKKEFKRLLKYGKPETGTTDPGPY